MSLPSNREIEVLIASGMMYLIHAGRFNNSYARMAGMIRDKSSSYLQYGMMLSPCCLTRQALFTLLLVQ